MGKLNVAVAMISFNEKNLILQASIEILNYIEIIV